MSLNHDVLVSKLMIVDLSGSERYRASPLPSASGRLAETMAPRVLVFDSGLGGLTVFAEIAKLRPDVELVYAADDAGFPYGRWAAPALLDHVVAVLDRLIAQTLPDAVVVACNTASTLVLSELRARFPDLPFVGTVPAIKPAAAQSRSNLISVLATPGTVARDYTLGLIDSFAGSCAVTLVGSQRLAGLAEAAMNGDPVGDDEIAAEIAPCFVVSKDLRTDVVVLACTHYPLLIEQFRRLAPWSVTWIDPAPAIARRLDAVLSERGMAGPGPKDDSETVALFTSGRTPDTALRAVLQTYRSVVAAGLTA